MADRTVLPSSASADSMGLASSLLKRRKTAGEMALWTFERARKGEDAVVRERGAEVMEADGAPAARKAARRMRCLAILVSPRSNFTSERGIASDLHGGRWNKEWRGRISQISG